MTRHQSKIEELIAEKCPGGVEFRELGEILDKVVGSNRKIAKSEISQTGKFPVYTQGSSQNPDGYSDDEKNVINDVPVILYGDHTNSLKWIDHAFVAGADGVKLISATEESGVNDKFLYHCLREKIREISDGYARHFAKLRKIKIPVPPIEVQEEIVKILDSFTQLEAELEAELEARNKQYEYYRDDLFNIKDVEYKSLGSLGTFLRGKRFVKSDIVADGVPCIHYGEMYTHYNVWAKETKSFLEPNLASRLRFAHPGDVIIVAAGETIEDIGNGIAWLGNSDVVIHDACFVFTHSLDPKYVSYFLYTRNFRAQIKRFISSGKISSIKASGLERAVIPVPSIKVQQEIVSILDKFNALIRDISTGLPAEILARRKQYEYYRSKLLTFKEYVPAQ